MAIAALARLDMSAAVIDEAIAKVRAEDGVGKRTFRADGRHCWCWYCDPRSVLR